MSCWQSVAYTKRAAARAMVHRMPALTSTCALVGGIPRKLPPTPCQSLLFLVGAPLLPPILYFTPAVRLPERLVVVLAAVLEIAHWASHHPWELCVHGQEGVLVHHIADQLPGEGREKLWHNNKDRGDEKRPIPRAVNFSSQGAWRGGYARGIIYGRPLTRLLTKPVPLPCLSSLPQPLSPACTHLHLLLQVVLPYLPHPQCVATGRLPGERAVSSCNHGRQSLAWAAPAGTQQSVSPGTRALMSSFWPCSSKLCGL